MRGILRSSIYTKREKEDQLLRLGGGSWSINLKELPEEAILIEYITDKDRYVINRYDAFKHGFRKTLGGEEKLVVPIKLWTRGTLVIEDL